MLKCHKIEGLKCLVVVSSYSWYCVSSLVSTTVCHFVQLHAKVKRNANINSPRDTKKRNPILYNKKIPKLDVPALDVFCIN